jgi:hypothetical protein
MRRLAPHGSPVSIVRFLWNRRVLQAFILIGGLVPVGAGLDGVLAGPVMAGLTMPAGVSFDSHFRYLSGLLLGIGLGFWSTVPAIERLGGRFQLLTAIVFCGGLCRLWSRF